MNIRLPLGQKCAKCKRVIKNGWAFNGTRYYCVPCKDEETRKRIARRYGRMAIVKETEVKLELDNVC